MVNLVSKVAIISAALVAVLYQFFFKAILFDILGFGRSFSNIHDFQNVRCERIDELGLEACEDMWLHEATGFLYMACSDSQSRTQWLPAVGHLNASGRSLNDRIAVLDTRGHGRLASRIHWLDIENFSGIKGDGTLNLHGFDVRATPHSDVLRILLVNHRPPLDPVTGEQLDATAVGANSTIELFQTKAGSTSMKHIRTYVDPAIMTPNRVSWINDHSFVFTNDHIAKTGFRRELDLLLGGGSVGFCDRNRCNIAKSTGFNMPNGLIKGRDGLIYVPNTISAGEIQVFTLTEHKTLQQVDTIHVAYPVDNLSVDENGDLWAGGIPQIYKWTQSSKNPFGVKSPGAAIRIRKSKGGPETGYEVDTILEDDGTVLPGTTIAVHDTQTGRIFMGGAVSPFITICETR